jgi:hypothetical protein
MTIWNILMPISKVCSHLVYFPHFGMFGPRKIWQPWSGKQPRAMLVQSYVTHCAAHDMAAFPLYMNALCMEI